MAHPGPGQEENILYELLVHAEWPLEPELHGGAAISLGGNFFYRTVTQTPANIWSLASSLWAYLSSASPVSPSLAKLVGGRCGWQLGVGAQGAVVAVVQGATLEIRAKKDEFASVVGKNTNLYLDPYPSWRRVAWSADCSMVGLAYSSGAVEVFNTLGTSIFTIYPPRYKEGAPQVDTSCALAALVFSDVRTQKIKWAAELLLVDYKGQVRSYLVSPTEGYQESHHFSLTKVYPSGISAATLYRDFLLVAGSCSFMNDTTLKRNGLGHGITLWRMLNDYPFYKQVATIDEEEYLPPSVGVWEHVMTRWSPPHHDCIFQLSVSPSSRHLAALHTSGSLSIWELPSLRKKKFWQLPDQPDHDARNPSFGEYIRPPGRQKPGVVCGPPRCHPAELSWWSEAAVIVARYSGSVTVSSVTSLRNLLGESPEFLEGVPQISEAHERAFLSLEVEQRGLNKRLLNSFSETMEGEEQQQQQQEEEEYPDSEEDEEDEEASLLRKSSRLARSVLFWVTDAERFRPHSRRPRVVQRTYRLLCLKSTTPEELFSRKIENEEYGEALALARSYGLDCDRVYQQQWRRSSVTVASIQDYLAKIRKRSWVLAECLSRVPEDIDATKELLLYGLRGTDLEAIIAIGEGKDEGEFIVCSSEDLDLEEGLDVPQAEYQVRMQERAAKELKRRHQLLSKVNFSSLTQEQKTVILARQKLLTYLDRLATYEVLLGGAHLAPEHYDAGFYDKFRSQSAISATVEFARDGDCGGVDVMFTYHGEETLPHRLAVLSNFPPTLGPYEYRSLLPECKGDKVFDWEQERLRDEDWCEEPACREAVMQDNTDPADFLYEERPTLNKFYGEDVDGALVSEWYQERAREVERCSHFVDVALDLLKLGRERGVEDLEELLDALDSLEVMVYEVGLSSITLDKFISMSDDEKVAQLMSTSTPETYIQNIRRWLLPFLARCEKGQSGSASSLLKAYMVTTAKTDLSLPLKILQHSRPDQPSAIIQSAEDMMGVAVECVYACERETQLPWAIACLECLPERESGRSSESLSRLHDLADALEAHLNAAELLSAYGVNVTPRHLKEIQGDVDQVGDVLTKVTRTAAKRKPRMGDEEWRRLLYDTLELQQKVFACVEPQVCLQKVIEALLGSEQPENIRLAGELMETRADHSPVSNPYLQQLPFSRAVQLVTEAATYYYNSSESHTDHAIDLAMQCLNLIESEHEDIQRERDLIAALQILPDFGINKLPLQVRLCEDRLTLVGECMAGRSTAYRHSSLLQHLAGLLRVCGEDQRARQAKVLTLIAQAALKAGDYTAAAGACDQLVGGEHEEGWVVCEALGRADRFSDLHARGRYLDFALTHASPDRLEDLLVARNEVELAVLYRKVNKQIEQQDTTGDSEEAFVDAPDEMEEEEEEEEEEFYDGSEEVEGGGRRRSILRGTLGVTKSVLSVTASTTTHLVSTVASKRFWKTAMNWMQPLVEVSLGEEQHPVDPEQETNTDFQKQGCHAFYADLFQEPHISSLGISYQSYAPPSLSSPALEFSLTLLRIALLEETFSLGTTSKANKTVLVEAARGVLKEDLAMGLLLLLSLREVEEARAVLAALPRTDVSLQVTQYYAALQLYTRLHPWTQPGIAPAFLHPPQDIIAAAAAAVDSGTTAKLGQEAEPLVELFRATQALVEDYMQGQALRRLGAGVDMARFLADAGYKEDTVLGLALTLEAEVLELAVALARKYQVSLWEVNMAHLQHLFSSGLGTEEVRQRVAQLDLVATLSGQPDDFTARMEETVLPAIDGKDLDRLLLYYTLLESSTQAASHVTLLKKLKGAANGLDYKLLLQPDSDPLETLRPVLTAGNVAALAKAVRGVPGRGGAGLEPSTVYCAWAQKYFFDLPKEHKLKTASDWVHRYEACGEYLQKMSAQDTLKFLRQLVLSDAATTKVPLEARAEMTRRALKFCRQQQSKQKFTEDEEGWMLAEDGRVWEAAAETLEQWGGHLDLLRCSTFLNLQQSDDPRLRDYARRFAQTGGDEKELQCVACAVLLEGGELDLLREVLAVFPEQAATTPEDIMMQTLKQLLGQWRTGAHQNLPEGRSQVSVLDHLLLQMHLYLEDGGELLVEEDVLEEVRELCGDEEVALEARVEVLTVAEKHFPLSEEDVQLVRVMRTGGVVAGAWPGEVVVPDQLATSESRAALLTSLTASTSSAAQAKALVHLLNLWPPFDQQEYSSAATNPWLAALNKVVEVTEDDSAGLEVVWEAARQAHSLGQLSGECLAGLVASLQGLGRGGLRCCCKVALLTSDPEVHRAVIEGVTALEEVTEADYDGELLKEIVAQGLVSPLVSTPLYGPLVNHLVESEDPDEVEQAVEQLSEAGHHREAASLACRTTSLPRTLLTAAAALKTYRRWL